MAEADLLDLALKCVRLAEAEGAEEAEAYLSRLKTVSASLENSQLVKAKTAWEEGIGVRISLQGRIGFAYTNQASNSALAETVRKALKLARVSQPDKDWRGFPARSSYPKPSGLYDGEVASAEVETVIGMASEMLNAALKVDRRIIASEGGVSLAVEERAIANSLGVEACEKATWARCFLEAVAKEAGETTPSCHEFDASRSLRLDLEKVGVEAARLAVSALGAGRGEDGRFSIVFGQHALLDLLSYTLMPAFKADNVQRGRSPLKGKLGKPVASKILTIVDDGLMEGGLHSWGFDDEGSPARRTTLVEHGILKGFLYDHYRAGKDGVSSTGNAFRPASYASTPIIDPTNFRIEPSTKSVESLLGEVGEGYYVPFLQGAHSSSLESGEFSVVAAPAWKIEGGVLAKPVRSIMLAGTIYEALENLAGLASNLRSVGMLVAPWVWVENVKVVGG
ncbi:MAG: TldD/PmbA family protein [Candidatus Hecatellaceae archaeon]